MTTSAVSQAPAYPGLLRSPSFDGFFIVGIFLTGICFGLLAMHYPAWLPMAVLVNTLIFGWHHVIATYMRLWFDKRSFKRSRYMLVYLFPAVLITVIALSMVFGIWILVSIYLYAQWFHYSRQSWGISRAYERAAGPGMAVDRGFLTQAAFYIFPVWGIFNRSHQDPGLFLSVELRVIPVSEPVLNAVAIIAITLFAIWLVRTAYQLFRKKASIPYTLFMLSHFAIFYIAYIAIPTIDAGWLAISVWHNMQYLLFVWLFNNRRFKGGVDPEAKILSTLSQDKNFVTYMLFSLAVTAVVYGAVLMSVQTVFVMVPLIVVYQVLNFHHYIVDAIIWRASWIRGGPPKVPVSG